MLDEQKKVVYQLVGVIQAIQIGRKTGILTATRGEGTTYEVGTITFVEGKVVQAKFGRRHDRDAFNWLSTWGMCQCTFVLSTTSGNNPFQEVSLASSQYMMRTPDPGPKRLSNQVVPCLVKPFDVSLHLIEYKGLSRMHRQLFLLVDGMRSLSEFARILKRDENEILALLYDLRDIAVITVSISL